MNNKQCSNCKVDSKYNERYDSYYCPKCHNWLEKKCKDPNCDFCPGRPEKSN